jgi:MFS family permease
MATSINFTAPLLLGALLDAYGPRMCSALSILLVMLGFLLFSASTPQWPTHLPAVILIAFGGPGVQSSIIHLSNLYPAAKATVTSIITGSFNLSFIVFFVFDRLWDKFGLSYQQLFLGYSAVCLAALLLSLLLWPDQPFSFQEQVLEEAGTKPDQLSSLAATRVGPIRAPSVFKKTTLGRLPAHRNGPLTSAATGGQEVGGLAPQQQEQEQQQQRLQQQRQAKETTGLLSSSLSGGDGGAAGGNIKEASFWEQLSSPPFMRVTTFIVVASFWANFYIGTIDIQLADAHTLSAAKQNFMVRVFTAVTTAGVLGIPIVGRLMDRCGFVATAAVTVTMAGLFGANVLWPVGGAGVWQLGLAFVAYALFRTFLFTYFFAYLADALGFRYFGVLAGASFLVAGCAGLLQSPLMEWGAGDCHLYKDPPADCDPGNWRSINALQLGCLLALYAIPLLDMRAKAAEEEARHARLMQEAGAGAGRRGAGGSGSSPYMTASGLRQQPAKYSSGSLSALREEPGLAGGGGGGARRDGGSVV